MRARPPDYPRIDPVQGLANLATGLHELRATGILASLDDERALRLLSTMYAPRFSSHLFASLVETHLRDAPDDDIVVHQGDWWSAARFETVMRRSFANVIWDDAEREHVHLVARGCMRPAGPHAWLAIYEAALAHVGDARRFVSLFVPVQPDERMYLLVTETQARALAKHHLLARSATSKRRLPPVIPGREATPPSVQALVEALRRKGVRATASGARIVIDLELPGGGRLVDRVKEDLARR